MSTTTDPDDPRLRPKDEGQQDAYLVLSPEERSRGFVRPLRTRYTHRDCGRRTVLGLSIAETYARDPEFYGYTYCVNCRHHFSVQEFDWDDGSVVGS